MDAIRSLAVNLARTPFLRLTKAGVLRVVRKHQFQKDGLNQKGRVRAIYDLAWEIRRKRARRFFARYARPVLPLRERLIIWRQKKARAAVKETQATFQTVATEVEAAFRHADFRKGRYHHLSVEVVQNEEEVGAWGRSIWLGWGRRDSAHRFSVTSDWVARVKEPGLAIRNRKMTLWAEREEVVGTNGKQAEVFRAIWCRQGRRFALVTERGFIVCLGSCAFHLYGPLEAVQKVIREAQKGREAIQAEHEPATA